MEVASFIPTFFSFAFVTERPHLSFIRRGVLLEELSGER